MKIAKIALFLLLISFCAEDSNLSIENNRLIANGYDNFRNKVKFVSDIINE